MKRALLVFCVLAATLAAAAVESYVRATIDESGLIRLETTRARLIAVKRPGDMMAVAPATISPDGRAVGWLERHATGAATQYAIQLVIYSSGNMRAFAGIGLPIFRWAFLNGGKRVAFEQEFTHGSDGVHYELRDITTGRMVDEYNPTADPDMDPGVTPKNAPGWVKELDAKQQ